VGTHTSGKDQMINKLGLPTNNPNDAIGKVQKQETIKDGFVFSDDLGYDKKGFPSLNTKEVRSTFADKSKKTEKKFEGREDELAIQTKNLMMSNIQKDNQKLLDIKEAQNKIKAIKAFGRFEKKYGEALNKYTLGGILPPEVNPNESYIFPDENPDYYNSNIPSIDTKFNERAGSTPRMNYLPQNNKLINYQPKLNPVDTNPIDVQKIAQDTSEKINPIDYLSPALNAGFALYNAFKKPKNYLAKPNNQAIEDVNQIETEPDNSQLYNRNARTLRAANVNAGNASPSIRNSLVSNNFANKLNADNEIGFNTQKERLDRIQNKQSLKAQIHANQNQWGEAAKSQFYAENAADRQANQEAVMTNLSNAVNDISNKKYDDQLFTIYKAGLKYFDFDSKTNKYIYKNNIGDVFYSSIPPSK